jgi:hypothetical protein
MHRWARLLKQQSLITVHHFPSKENQLPFAAKKWKFAVFLLQQTNRSYRFPFAEFWKHGDIHKWASLTQYLTS